MTRDERPRIVHLVHSLEGGGTERTLVELLNKFDPTRLRHDVITLRKAGSLARFLPDHVACRAFGITKRNRMAGLRLARVARTRGAAVIHARNTGCWFDAIIASLLTPQIALVLGFHGLEFGKMFSQRQRRLVRLGLSVGAGFASVSEAGRRQLVQEAGVPPERIDVLPNGVDLVRFRPADLSLRHQAREELGIKRTSLVVGMVGTLAPIKRHDLLIEAVRAVRSGICSQMTGRIPNIILLVVGQGPERESIASYARQLGMSDRIRLIGPRENIPRMLAAMDLYVCCSDSEGMCNALLEALACGVPAIVTDVGDNALVVRDGVEGIVIPRSSVLALTLAVTSLATDPSRRRTMKDAARNRAVSFDFSHVIVAYERWYRQLAVSQTGLPICQSTADRMVIDVRAFHAGQGHTLLSQHDEEKRFVSSMVR